MTSFKKMALIDADELNRLRDKKITQYNPTVRTMANLDEEMESVLREKTLNAEEKLARYNSALLNFKNIYSLNTRAIPATAAAPIPAAGPAAHAIPHAPLDPIAPLDPFAAAAGSHAGYDIDLALSDREKKTLQPVIDYLDFHRDVISQLPSGEASINNRPIPGSNYGDLLRSLNSSSRRLNRTGQAELIPALADIKFPHDLARNPRVSGLIKKEYEAAGSAFGSTRSATVQKREMPTQSGHGTHHKRLRFVIGHKSKKRPPGIHSAKVYRLYRT